jgi:hypothetical protein
MIENFQLVSLISHVDLIGEQRTLDPQAELGRMKHMLRQGVPAWELHVPGNRRFVLRATVEERFISRQHLFPRYALTRNDQLNQLVYSSASVQKTLIRYFKDTKSLTRLP